MNIIEAIKSGMPFKRKCWDNWIISNERTDKLVWLKSIEYAQHQLCLADFTADDWETQEKKVEVTKKQLELAIECVSHFIIETRAPLDHNDRIINYVTDQIARHLGFD